MDDPRFGGLSAVHVFPGGGRFLAVSDRGAWTEGRIARDAEGRIAAIDAAPMRPLRRPGGAPLPAGRTDAEGIAVAPDGTVHVSFEGPARVLRYARIDGPAEALPAAPGFHGMGRNSSLEALAIGPDGALYTLPERSGRIDRPFPVFRLLDGVWDQPFVLPRRGDFLPVGADIGPDGRFTLLERAFAGLGFFASRIRRFDLTGGAEEVLVETAYGLHDNLEGISVWRDAGGGLVATLVSDDNFHFLQRSEILEYRLPG